MKLSKLRIKQHKQCLMVTIVMPLVGVHLYLNIPLLAQGAGDAFVSKYIQQRECNNYIDIKYMKIHVKQNHFGLGLY